MTAEEIITEVQENSFEWLEMSENPSQIIASILANKIVSMNNYIMWLEKRLKNEAQNRIY